MDTLVHSPSYVLLPLLLPQPQFLPSGNNFGESVQSCCLVLLVAWHLCQRRKQRIIVHSSGAPCTAYPNALQMPCACKHAPVALLLLPICDQAPSMSASLRLFIAAATLHNCL